MATYPDEELIETIIKAHEIAQNCGKYKLECLEMIQELNKVWLENEFARGRMARQGKSKTMNKILKCLTCKTGPRAGKSQKWYRCYGLKCLICDECRDYQNQCFCSGEHFSKYFCEFTKKFLTSDTMRFKCKNDVNGCQVYLGEKAMIAHERECIYRVVECPNLDCSAKVQFHELLDHMEKKKEFSVAKIGIQHINIRLISEEFLMKEFKLIPIRFEMDGNVFFSIGEAKGGTFYHWVYMIGSQNEAKNYSYTLEYFGTSKITCNMYCGEVVPIDETSKSIIETGKCIGINYKVFKRQFIDENFSFNYSVKIFNLKEEATGENVESELSNDAE